MPPRESSDDHLWLLTATERANDDTRLPAWSEGNRAEVLAHGRPYFAALAEALADVGEGDHVFFSQWRGDDDQLVDDDGTTVSDALTGAAERGAVVKGLVWRSHGDVMGFQGEQNRTLAHTLEEAGGEVLLDQRVRSTGSHHQKFVVVRHPDDPSADVAFVGGIDLARGRRDDAEHHGDPLTREFPEAYGETPAWHDVQLRITGPAVGQVDDTFRERWEDPAGSSRLPWRVVADALHPVTRTPQELPERLPDPPAAGDAAVQLLRTYPRRHPTYPFARRGERSVALGYRKALRRARRLVYVEDQYLWSTDVAAVFAEALEREPQLHLVVVVPRLPDDDAALTKAASDSGQVGAINLLHRAGEDRVHVLDIENEAGLPIYVHAKVCVVDDVWAAVGSANLNRRSWTHDSELTAAVLDGARDPREPTDPSGRGDGARVFARELRLELLREHLGRAEGDDADLLDPMDAVAAITAQVTALERWHDDGEQGPRPTGRLRRHRTPSPAAWLRHLLDPVRREAVDPDGRPYPLRARSRF
ncbi:phospholipase D-like domain-containing protein [Rhodococcus aerolatus]